MNLSKICSLITSELDNMFRSYVINSVTVTESTVTVCFTNKVSNRIYVMVYSVKGNVLIYKDLIEVENFSIQVKAVRVKTIEKRKLESFLDEMENRRERYQERARIPQYDGFRKQWSDYLTECLGYN